MTTYAADAMLKWGDEDTLCEHFFSSIRGSISTPTGVMSIQSYKIRGRGPGAPEKTLGADGIGLVSIATPYAKLSGFFLFQAKKAYSASDILRGARAGCSNMLCHSAASYLLILLPTLVKMIGAMAVHSTTSREPSLSDIPYIGFPRFLTDHLLHGIMLEPLSRARTTLTPALKAEIKHVISIVGSHEQQLEGALATIRGDIEELGLGIE